MIAGPSEIMVIADGQSNPAYIAADLLSLAVQDRGDVRGVGVDLLGQRLQRYTGGSKRAESARRTPGGLDRRGIHVRGHQAAGRALGDRA